MCKRHPENVDDVIMTDATYTLHHRYNIRTGISNRRDFDIHPRFGLNIDHV